MAYEGNFIVFVLLYTNDSVVTCTVIGRRQKHGLLSKVYTSNL